MYARYFHIIRSNSRNPENPSERKRPPGPRVKYIQMYEPNTRNICNTLTSVQKDNLVLEMVRYVSFKAFVLTPRRNEYGKRIRKMYEKGDIEEKRSNMTDLVPREDGIANTITTVLKDNIIMEQGNYEHNEECGMPEPVEARPKGKGWKWVPEEMCWIRLRKLTPRECFRLMGCRKQEIDKIQTAVFPNKNDVVPIRYGLPEEGSKETRISDSQQYKMAGNSIVVDCLSGIFNNLFTNEEIEKDTLF